MAPTGDGLVSLHARSGLRSVAAGALRFGAGTRIAQASSEAWGEGCSFTNEPDINLQSLAGAIATSTHGTGLGLQSLSGQVDSLRLVTPDGEPLELPAAAGDRFLAACCNVGALGVVAGIGFRHEPAYRLDDHLYLLLI